MRFYHILFFQFVIVVFQAKVVAQNSNYHQSVERRFDEGVEYLIKSNYSAARKCFEDYISADIGNSDRRALAEYHRAYAALHLYHNDGEYLMNQFLQQHLDHPKSLVANYDLGNFYYLENNYSKAIKYLLEAE